MPYQVSFDQEMIRNLVNTRSKVAQESPEEATSDIPVRH